MLGAIPVALATDRLHAVSTDGRPDQRYSPAVLNRQTHLPGFVSRPRMVFSIDLSHPALRNVGVSRRGRNVGVAQDGLHRPEIGAVLNHVRGAGMAEHMRTHVTADSLRPSSYHLPQPLPGKLSPPATDEEPRRIFGEQRAHGQPRTQSSRSPKAEGCNAFFIAFAAYQNVSID